MRFETAFAVGLLAVISTVSAGSVQPGVPIGPSGGSFSAVTIFPVNPDVAYGGLVYGGIYRTTDGGDSWSYLGFAGDTIISAIAMDPWDPSQVFFSWHLDHSPYSSGVYRSLNGGVTWQAIPLEARTVACGKATPGLLYVGNNDGVHRSTDGGSSFTHIAYGFGLNNITVIEPDPTDDAIVYLGTDNAVYKSTDTASSWTMIRDVGGAFVEDIAVSPVDHQRLLVGCDFGYEVLHLSSDGGSTWSTKDLGLQVHAVFCDDADSLAVNAAHLSSFIRSTDFGASWTTLCSGRFTGGAMSGDRIFLLDQGRETLLRSTDKGASWEDAVAGVNGSAVLSLPEPGSPGGRIIATTKSGAFAWNGSAWDTLAPHYGGLGGASVWRNIRNGHLYARGSDWRFSRSTDGGMTWEQRGSLLSGLNDVAAAGDTLFMAPMAHFEGVDWIRRSTNEGVSWSQASAGLSYNEYFSFSMVRGSSSKLYTATRDTLYRTLDGGASWSAAGVIPGRYIIRVMVDPDSAEIVYAIGANAWPTFQRITASELYVSRDGGATFTPVECGLDRPMALRFIERWDLLVAGGRGGLTVSNDRGRTWAVSGTLPPTVVVTRLAMPDTGSRLYAGTERNGVFEFTLSIDSLPPPVPVNVHADLLQDSVIRIAWACVDPDSHAAGFRVFRRTFGPGGPGDPELIVETPDTTILDTFFIPGVSVGYRVKAYDLYGHESGWSEEAIAAFPETASVAFRRGWNLLSVPVSVEDRSTSALFPTAGAEIFGYDGSYSPADSLEYGRGYWMKYDASGVANLPGLYRYRDTVAVSAGWNLIGGPSFPVAATAVTSIPPGMSTSRFFAYTGTYAVSDTINPGGGYWVKTESEGWLVLAPGNGAPSARRIRISGVADGPPPPPAEAPVSDAVPASFLLERPFPNPFNSSCLIRIHLPEEARVTVRIYDVTGRSVRTIIGGGMPPGVHTVAWDGTRDNGASAPTGVYLVRMMAGTSGGTEKILLVR